jgi:hypothetical protein
LYKCIHSLPWASIDAFNNLTFLLYVPNWFAKIYAKEFALKEYLLVLEVITLMVRNTVEGVKYTCIMMDCFVLVVVCS